LFCCRRESGLSLTILFTSSTRLQTGAGHMRPEIVAYILMRVPITDVYKQQEEVMMLEAEEKRPVFAGFGEENTRSGTFAPLDPLIAELVQLGTVQHLQSQVSCLVPFSSSSLHATA